MIGLADLFLGAFLFGLIFTLASVLLGGHFGLGHHAADLSGGDVGDGLGLGDGLHAGHGAEVGAAGHPGEVGPGGHGGTGGQDPGGLQTRLAPISPWNLTALTAFIAWFGGVGYLALTAWQLALGLTLLLALAAGFVGWAVVSWFYSRVLLRSEGRMDAADYRLEGVVARATAPISPERIGEVQFTRAGALRSESARSSDESTIAPGTEVVIVRYERGMAYVQPWEAYVGREAPEGRQGGN